MTAPTSGRTADENEMREQVADLIRQHVFGSLESPKLITEGINSAADALLSGPLAPILQEAATARKERDAIQAELAGERLMRISAQASAEHWERRYEDLRNGPNG